MTRDSEHIHRDGHEERAFDPDEPRCPPEHPQIDPDPDGELDFELDPVFEPERDPEPYPLVEFFGDGIGRCWHPDNGCGRGGRLLHVRDASRRSGIGVSTLYRWVREGRLRRCVISRSPLRFDWDKLLDELQGYRWRD